MQTLQIPLVASGLFKLMAERHDGSILTSVMHDVVGQGRHKIQVQQYRHVVGQDKECTDFEIGAGLGLGLVVVVCRCLWSGPIHATRVDVQRVDIPRVDISRIADHLRLLSAITPRYLRATLLVVGQTRGRGTFLVAVGAP